MKKRIIGIAAAVIFAGLFAAGCGQKDAADNTATDTDTQAAEAENTDTDTETEEAADTLVSMPNPIVSVDSDEEFEKQLGIKLDTSYISAEVQRSIIGESTAQVVFYVTNVNGDETEITLRATKDDSVADNPVEALAGVYASELADQGTVEIPVDNGVIEFHKVSDAADNIDIAYFDYDGVHYTITYGNGLSQMSIAEINDTIMNVIGAVQLNSADESSNESSGDGNVIMPLEESIDADDPEGEYSCTIKAVNDSDGQVTADFELYAMELFDAVDVANLKPGDTIVVDGEEIAVESVEEGDSVEMPSEDGEGSENKSVYLINGGLENGGIELIAAEGGTYRYFGFDDMASYSLLAEVTLPISEDAIITDHAHDLDGDTPNSDGTVIAVSDFKAYFEDDMVEGVSYFNSGNTKVRFEDGQAVEITRSYTP